MTEHCLTKKIVTLLKLLYMINIYCCLCQEPFLLNYFTHWFYSLVLLFFILLFFVSVVTLLFNSGAFFFQSVSFNLCYFVTPLLQTLFYSNASTQYLPHCFTLLSY